MAVTLVLAIMRSVLYIRQIFTKVSTLSAVIKHVQTTPAAAVWKGIKVRELQR